MRNIRDSGIFRTYPVAMKSMKPVVKRLDRRNQIMYLLGKLLNFEFLEWYRNDQEARESTEKRFNKSVPVVRFVADLLRLKTIGSRPTLSETKQPNSKNMGRGKQPHVYTYLVK